MDNPPLSLSNKNKKTKEFFTFDLLSKVVFNKNMTLSLRNFLIKIFLAFSLIFCTVFTLSIFYLKSIDIYSIEKIRIIIKNLFTANNSFQKNPIFWIFTTTPIIFIFSIITTLILFHYFKKKIYPEIFFFILFILSLSMQTIRLFQLQFILLNLSPYFGVIITRLFYFFKLFGLFCLFASSLFPIGIKFQKFGTILLSILLLSLTISTLLPIDLTSLNVTLLYKISDNASFLVMVATIRILTIINYTRVVISTKSKNSLLVLISSILIIAGDDLLLIIPIPLLAFFLILIGTALYSRSIYNYYLWT